MLPVISFCPAFIGPFPGRSCMVLAFSLSLGGGGVSPPSGWPRILTISSFCIRCEEDLWPAPVGFDITSGFFLLRPCVATRWFGLTAREVGGRSFFTKCFSFFFSLKRWHFLQGYDKVSLIEEFFFCFKNFPFFSFLSRRLPPDRPPRLFSHSFELEGNLLKRDSLFW